MKQIKKFVLIFLIGLTIIAAVVPTPGKAAAEILGILFIDSTGMRDCQCPFFFMLTCRCKIVDPQI